MQSLVLHTYRVAAPWNSVSSCILYSLACFNQCTSPPPHAVPGAEKDTAEWIKRALRSCVCPGHLPVGTQTSP